MNFKAGEGVRIDTGFVAGDSVTPYYDPMIAKVIVHGATRAEALAALLNELDDAVVIGPKTNLAFLRGLLRQSGVCRRNGGHRLHRRQSRTPRGPAASAEHKGRACRGAASHRAARRGPRVASRPVRPVACRQFLRARRFAPHRCRRHRRWRAHARASERRRQCRPRHGARGRRRGFAARGERRAFTPLPAGGRRSFNSSIPSLRPRPAGGKATPRSARR